MNSLSIHDHEIDVQHQSLADILIPHGVHSRSVGLLWALGVRSIANCLDLTASEAREAGLTDLQLRTLKRVACEMSPSADSAHRKTSAGAGAGASSPSSSSSHRRAEDKYAADDDGADSKAQGKGCSSQRAGSKRDGDAKGSGGDAVAEAKVEKYNDLAAAKFVSAVGRLRSTEGASLLAVFKRLDRNGDGEVSGAELWSGAQEMGVELSKEELDGLVKRFDCHGDGRIDLHEFMAFIEGDHMHKDSDVVALLDDLRAKLLRDHRPGRHDDFHREFQRFDADWNGEVDYRELHQVLTKDFGYKLTVHEAERVAAHFPGGGGGSIKYNDFVRFLQGSASLGSAEAIAEAKEAKDAADAERYDDVIFQKIVDALQGQARAAGLSTVFEDFDVNNDGFVSRAEFASAMEGLGLHGKLSHREMILVMEHFDPTGDGQISHGQFCEAFSSEVAALERQDSGSSTLSSHSSSSSSSRRAPGGSRR